MVDPEKRERIAAYFLAQPESGLTQAKLELGEEVSYAELKAVAQYLKFMQQIPEASVGEHL